MPRPLKATRSPGLTEVISAPTRSTTPAPSDPRILGGCLGVGKRSSRTETSTGFTVAAATLTRICAGPGSGVGTSSYTRTSGPPYSWMRTAFTAASSAGVVWSLGGPYPACGRGSPASAVSPGRPWGRGRGSTRRRGAGRACRRRSGRQGRLRRLPPAPPQPPHDVPDDHADGAEDDDERQQRGQHERRDAGAVAEQLDGVPEGAAEGVAGVDRRRRRVLLATRRPTACRRWWSRAAT